MTNPIPPKDAALARDEAADRYAGLTGYDQSTPETGGLSEQGIAYEGFQKGWDAREERVKALEAENERLRKALQTLVVCCEHESSFRNEMPHAFVIAGRQALAGDDGREKV